MVVCCTSHNLLQPIKGVNNGYCCGLDGHNKSTTAYAITLKGNEIETFGIMTHDLFHLVAWIIFWKLIIRDSNVHYTFILL
jgi:hypothetical protein